MKVLIQDTKNNKKHSASMNKLPSSELDEAMFELAENDVIAECFLFVLPLAKGS